MKEPLGKAIKVDTETIDRSKKYNSQNKHQDLN